MLKILIALSIFISSVYALDEQKLNDCQKELSSHCPTNKAMDRNCLENAKSKLSIKCKTVMAQLDKRANEFKASNCLAAIKEKCPVDKKKMAENAGQAIKDMQACMEKEEKYLEKKCAKIIKKIQGKAGKYQKIEN